MLGALRNVSICALPNAHSDPIVLAAGVRVPQARAGGRFAHEDAGHLGAAVARELIALGMPMAFDRLTADFSGINGLRAPHADALFISTVVHKAFVEINEEGAEAAAATAVEMKACAGLPPPVVTFRADHPFLFAIRDTRSGAILFLGRVADPTMEG